MKKLLPYILIIVLIFGTFSPVVVKAQSAGGVFATLAGLVSSGGVGSVIQGIIQPADWVLKALAWLMFNIVMRASTLLLGLSGIILDLTISKTIVQMSSQISGMTGISIAWRITRDVMNIAFIFLLIYESIKLIIGIGSINSIKKFVTGVVLAAILVNFSLFFTKVLIDASNIITVSLYNAAIDTSSTTVVGGGGSNFSQTNLQGLSTPFMNALGMTGFFSQTSFSTVIGADASGTQAIIFSMAGSALFIITAFIFFAISIMLIIRYIVLLILMMLSPIAYMGLAFPFMKTYADQWWGSLKGQLLFAPLYMFMALITLLLMSSPGFVTKGNWSDIFDPSTAGGGTAGLLLNFIVIIGLSIASLITAKSAATKGSSIIGQATGKLSAFAGGVVMGGAARLGRNTFGRAGNAISNSEYLKDKEVSGNVVTRNLARYGRSTGTKAATSTFDARSSGAYKAFEGSVGKGGLGFGKGADAKKVNFQKDLETKAKNEAKYAESLKPSDYAMEKIKKDRGHTDLEDIEKKAKEEQKNSVKMVEELLDREKELNTELERAKSVDSGATEAEIATIENKIKEAKDRRKIELDREKELKDNVAMASKKVKESQENLDKIYKDRVSGYASLIEDESTMSRYVKNILKAPSLTSTSKRDNFEIAKKIKSVTKEKGADKQLEEYLKKRMKEAKEKGEKFGEDDSEEEIKKEEKKEDSGEENKEE